MTMQARYSKAGKTKYESSLSQALWLDEIRAQQQCIYVSVSVFLRGTALDKEGDVPSMTSFIRYIVPSSVVETHRHTRYHHFYSFSNHDI